MRATQPRAGRAATRVACLLLLAALHVAAGEGGTAGDDRRGGAAAESATTVGLQPGAPSSTLPRGDACSGLWPVPRSCNCSGDLTPDKKPETSGTIGMDADHFQFVADNPAAKGSARLQRAFERIYSQIFHSTAAVAPTAENTIGAGARSAGADLFSLEVELGTDNETLTLGVDESYSLR
jgi:hypothetical protein